MDNLQKYREKGVLIDISPNLIETETVAFDPNDIILSENIHRENEKGMFEFI